MQGIPALRRLLAESWFSFKHGPLPITWLLRADRQILEVYGDASFCFRQFHKVWAAESMRFGSEIGWHPHLYQWDSTRTEWIPGLGDNEDLGILDECLAALRGEMEITSVRTGWDYHSPALFQWFDRAGLLVDASAIPGVVQNGSWFFDWRGTPRQPYFPAAADCCRPATEAEQALQMIEMPVTVRRLNFVLHALRYSSRKLRWGFSRTAGLTDWESARFQGVRITAPAKPFKDAVLSMTSIAADRSVYFLTTYFHPDELLSPLGLRNTVANLEAISTIVRRLGYELIPTTLTAAAQSAKRHLAMEKTVIKPQAELKPAANFPIGSAS